MNQEILQVVEAIAKEKGIGKEVILNMIEHAMSEVGKKKYGHMQDIKAEIDRKTGDMKLYRSLTEDELTSDYAKYANLKDGEKDDEFVNIDGKIYELLPPIEIKRHAALFAKHTLVEDMQYEEKNREYIEFQKKIGEVVSGYITRIDKHGVVISLGRSEGLIKASQLIPNEEKLLKIGDRIKAYVKSVARSNTEPQVLLSRTDGKFIQALFALEVPEIRDGTIEVNSIARDPGSRAKIAVFSRSQYVDAKACCIGLRASRVQAISAEINNEKIEVVLFDSDITQFAINSLVPMEGSVRLDIGIKKAVVHQNKKKIEIIVPEEYISKALGRRGQNVKLASKLIGWHIDVMTSKQESTKRVEEFNSLSAKLASDLNLEEPIAHLLLMNGFSSVHDVANASQDKILKIQEFDEEIVSELQHRAIEFVNNSNKTILARLEELGLSQSMLDLIDLDLESIKILAENGIKSLEDLAEISPIHFRKILPFANISNQKIKEWIAIAAGNTTDL